ncbi:hypothetical protein Dpo_17c00130 [Desulfotignum phosphitoxidans DSM 13687]|uniref:Uncharacterized protein n=2 Tax=Desulfotignum phosphitoxidans TaxID=190898 RepID=S0FW08_9BACT|nr:hypothetical protein Dpo_17c00130 [Desulfotignum phosphitoxidans DSM 13687]
MVPELFKKWLPWRFLIRRVTGFYGFLDPVTLMARLRQFGKPSEVQEPIELLRAGLIFHARGLVNTRAIQYNLDWVWPFWVVKQFTPQDASFIPRGFSFSHINVTHRNWTAVGHPDLAAYPIIDPRGLVTPLFDAWSIDVWLMTKDNNLLLPSRQPSVVQTLDLSGELAVTTATEENSLSLVCTARVKMDTPAGPVMQMTARGSMQTDTGWLVVSIRPYNPEGIYFIDHIRFKDSRFVINHTHEVHFGAAPEKVLFSTYDHGDVALELDRPQAENQAACPIGMATAAAFFPIGAKEATQIDIQVPLNQDTDVVSSNTGRPAAPASHMVSQTAALAIPDAKFQFLYDAAVRTLLLLSADEVVPGPYTYRRFWFRDACLMMNALLGLGLAQRCERLIQGFESRQKLSGYFQSQEGEWDSNGQVLWIAHRFAQCTGQGFSTSVFTSLMKGARWIVHKRRSKKDGKPHDGLLPAGFSAEHLGPNDYYYWDDFWGVAGLRAAAELAKNQGNAADQNLFAAQAMDFETCIFTSLAQSPGYQKHQAMPASPYRRMDAGAVGSLVADYPLQITSPNDAGIMNTLSYLMSHCSFGNAFFQDMIHSGINIYLTLAVAQTFLRSRNPRYKELIHAVADLATPTGQWPEAINPLTGGGCMGDGQHGWAAAEWVMMMRSLFIREEGRTLILGSGIFPEWLEQDTPLCFGPTLVPGGVVSVRFVRSRTGLELFLTASVKGRPLPCTAAVPGYRPKELDTSHGYCLLEPASFP